MDVILIMDQKQSSGWIREADSYNSRCRIALNWKIHWIIVTWILLSDTNSKQREGNTVYVHPVAWTTMRQDRLHDPMTLRMKGPSMHSWTFVTGNIATSVLFAATNWELDVRREEWCKSLNYKCSVLSAKYLQTVSDNTLRILKVHK